VEGNTIFTIIQILEKQNQFPDIEKLMSDWLKRLSKVLQETDKFTVPIRVCGKKFFVGQGVGCGVWGFYHYSANPT
jgi:hypothetical protein